ncbi:solute carrier organic anion transporter family member 4C1-like isoform X2 [Branchiostoma lanceolatum]|uniref:solute carrier organic anion transporter family member 4C1-like isoform X2 n=1 Tax=Branchiostoma lanceolatum TaxID=7740 RepID=UPI003453F38D
MSVSGTTFASQDSGAKTMKTTPPFHPKISPSVESETMAPDPVAADVAVTKSSAHTAAADLGLTEPDKGQACGWSRFRPACLQCCNNANGVLFFLCMFSFTQGVIVNGLVNVSITSIETRFELPSSNTGIVSASYDIAFVVLALFVTFHAGQGNSKPKWLAFGSFSLGLGALIYSLPHFTTGPYVYGTGQTETCDVGGNSTSQDCSSGDTAGSGLRNYLYVFILGQLLHGVGGTPLYTLGTTFLDENVERSNSGVYIGLFFAASALGPAAGYLIGGQFLNIYTDIDIGRNGSELTEADPRWVGAWWIGFLMCTLLAWSITIPLLGYPKELPGAAEIKANKESEAHAKGGVDVASQPDFGKSWRDFPMAIKILLCNPTFMFVSLAGAFEGFLTSGLATFGPKFVEMQFSQTSGWAAMLCGFVVVPGAAGGNILGGVIMKFFKLKCRGMLRLCIILGGVCLALYLVFLVQCPNIPFAGVTQRYTNGSMDPVVSGLNLSSQCNTDCYCQEEFYTPTCGADGMQYFSPCHAGCTVLTETDGTKRYDNCTCIWYDSVASLAETLEGKCDSTCGTMPLFLAVFFVIMLLTFANNPLATGATLRVVPDNQRSFALGVQNIVGRLVGVIPGPIITGAILDSACLLWGESCGQTGACLVYDNQHMGYGFLALMLSAKALATILFVIAYVSYKPPPSVGMVKTMTQTTLTRMDSSAEIAVIST